MIYRVFRRLTYNTYRRYSHLFTTLKFKANDVSFSTFRTIGIPYVMVAHNGICKIGRNLTMNNSMVGNPIGCMTPCTIFVDSNAELYIGNDVGISQTTLVSHCRITIGNRVKIGGGTCIYTTDFHSLNANVRCGKNDLVNKICKPVIIEDDVFIGAFSIILKGVTIGARSIVGAASVVTKSVPPNQLWAGNPARFIRNL